MSHKATASRYYSAHHMLIHVARSSNRVAQLGSNDDMPAILTAMTFTALAIEGLCNAVGFRTIKRWEDFESASPNAKLRIIADELKIAYQPDEAPWAYARFLMRFRNKIVHAKPEDLKTERVLLADETLETISMPESRLEGLITRENSSNSIKTYDSLVKLLRSSIPAPHRHGLFSERWTSTLEFPAEA